jgi:outer membrane protein assembly factor BamB
LLVGGASLGVLIVIGAFLFLSLTRGSADEMFAAASEDYRAGSYSQSIKRFEKYLDTYPNDKNASLARVRMNMAHLWQVAGDPSRGLKVAKEILPKIEGEESVGEAREELASLLPGIAEGFLEKAKLSSDTDEQEDLLASTEEAMTLVNNPTYIPSTLRKSQLTRIDAINDDIARVQRDIDRETNLTETIEFILASVQSGNTKAAYQARYELLGKYPGLDSNDELHEAVLKITEKERERVQVAEQPIDPLADDTAAADTNRVVLANRSGQVAVGAKGHVVYVLGGGSVFGIDATNGDVLWRRFVGLQTAIEPFPLSTQEESDAIAVDGRTNDLMRLEARTGKLIWRLPIGEPFAEPVIRDKVLLVSAKSGKLLVVDPTTGKSERQVSIPQGIDVPPGVDRRRPQIYQVGEHDNLYVFSADTLECEEVYYIGHKPGTVVVPPVMALGYLFVVENAGPDYALLHILATDEDGLRLRTAQKSIRVQGRVVTTPIVSRRRILVVTDRRAIELYDVDPNNEAGTPVTTAARQSATSEAPIISHALLDRGYLWLANDRFTKYQVQAATGKLPSEWVQDENDIYVAPLRLVRDVVVSVHRRQGTEGLTVSATPINEKVPSWQTDLAVPIRQIRVVGQQVQALNARGQLFNISPDDVSAGTISRAAQRAIDDARQMLYLTHSELLDSQRWVLSPSKDYTQMVIYDPSNASQSLRLLQTTVPPETATNSPVAFDGGLLIPRLDGLVSLVDPVTGGDKLHAFHPEIEAGSQTQWVRPAVLADGQEFIIADSQKRLYRIAVRTDPQPHLAQVQSVDLGDALVGQLATVGQVAYGVMRSGADDIVTGFALPKLETTQQWPLAGRLAWGPERVGDVVLVASNEQLMCVDGEQNRRWTLTLEHGGLAGPPTSDGGNLLVASKGGTVLQIDAASGEVTASQKVSEPLASGVVPFDDQLLVATCSGSVFVVAKPQR